MTTEITVLTTPFTQHNVLIMRPQDIRYIVIHCSATRSNQLYPPILMERDHRHRGFKSAGYHYYIRRTGRIIGMRSILSPGAHALGYNRCSIGVCYEGGLDEYGLPCDTRTPEQKSALIRLLRRLRSYATSASIVGHRDLSPDLDGDGSIEPHEWLKQCPSFDAKAEYAELAPMLPEEYPVSPYHAEDDPSPTPHDNGAH